MSIKVNNLSYSYLKKTPNEVLALDQVSLEVFDHDFLALVGETGSGKSTLVEMLNALLIPDSGEVIVDDFVVTNKKQKNKRIKELRKHVGVVFQFPEYQLFEETIIKDVAFGLKNYGVDEKEAIEKAKEALAMVGIDESYYERSPFELSGGEKRRVAIAGILVMDPDILVLDEPTAGLDPSGSQMIIDLMQSLYNKGKTIILVSHNMDLVIKCCKHAIVMHRSKVIFDGTPFELFSSLTEDMAVEIPPIFKFANKLNEQGFHIDLSKIKSVEDLAKQISMEINHD